MSYRWNHAESHAANIDAVRSVIRTDVRLSDRQARDLLDAVDLVTPELASSHGTVMLRRGDATYRLAGTGTSTEVATVGVVTRVPATRWIVPAVVAVWAACWWFR